MKVSASLIAIANAGSINVFGAQRTTEMNTPDAPFCINCSDATLGQFPWQLSLQTTGHFCGGSILSATALSTAAHCRKSSYYAVAGTIDNQSGQKIQTNTFIGHPQYNGSKIINDFAVGKVSTPFTLNSYAQPIPLVDPSSTRPADGHPLQTSGYGYHQMGSNGRPISQVSRYLIWNMFPSKNASPSGLVKQLITPSSAPMHQQPPSAPVILADHSSCKKKANGDFLA